jgi:hypothetical protein
LIFEMLAWFGSLAGGLVKLDGHNYGIGNWEWVGMLLHWDDTLSVVCFRTLRMRKMIVVMIVSSPW